jgi:hypothetical protein
MEHFLRFLKSIVLILAVTLSSSARAEEVFDYYPESESDDRSIVQLNSIINREFEVFTNLMNANYSKEKFMKECSVPELKDYALDFFDNNFTRIGNRLRDLTDGTPKKNRPRIQFWMSRTRVQQAYEGVGIKACCAMSVNIKGNVIGIDKIDHFFGNGGILYRKRLRDPKTTTNDLVQLNKNQEDATWGMSISKIKSYGDLVANWEGMNFYQDLFESPASYLKCENGKISVSRKFQIENQVHPGWSESINCPAFPDKKYAERFAQNLKKLKLKCPMDETKCTELVNRYKDQPRLLHTLVSPVCRLKTPMANSVEDERSLDWDNYRGTMGGLRAKEVLKYLGVTQ